MKKVIIVGGGFAGLNAAKKLGNVKGIDVTLIDRRNHHLFQPLLYQVAMAGLSPADIAAPIRSILARYRNIRVLQGRAEFVDLEQRLLHTDFRTFDFDYLMLACGAAHSYFGNDIWQPYAPGLKTIEDATKIRRRVLCAFEMAERESDPNLQQRYLTFVIVGGGPTGVELAGAIGEMSRYTLAREFKNIDPKLARIILVEGSPRILAPYTPKLSSRAVRDLERLGVHVRLSSLVTYIGPDGVRLGEERVDAATVLWAAGVEASPLGRHLDVDLDRQGRIIVESDLRLKSHPNVFIAGDQAHFSNGLEQPLPGVAAVAVQQGRHIAKNIRRDLKAQPRLEFRYVDKGKMAAIGGSRAIAELGPFRLGGRMAWLTWLLVHIYYLTGFKNRLSVTLQWGWSYFAYRYRRGARLIVGKDTEPQPGTPQLGSADRQYSPRRSDSQPMDDDRRSV